MNLDNVSTHDLETELNFRKLKPRAYTVHNICASCDAGVFPLYRVEGNPYYLAVDSTGRKYVTMDDGQEKTIRLKRWVDYDGLVAMLIDLGVPKDLVELARSQHEDGKDERPWNDLLKRKGL